MNNIDTRNPELEGLAKCPTGIRGLDEITDGGLPAGRPTLVVGGPGCGKTMLAVEFLVRGATVYDEPGVFVAFEETAGDLAKNVASLGFDLNGLIAQKKMVIDHVHIDPAEIEETGEYDLEGLFIRLGHAIDSIGAKRVALDTIEVLFSGFMDHAVLRAELRRLFSWLKEKEVTAIITGEAGETTFSRYGLEEYVADCVIALDNRVVNQIATRRLRIVKYRGSAHGMDEYPFLIDADGFSVIPVTTLGLDHEVSSERVSSGIKDLDAMLGGGYYRGSSILVSGIAGTGKTSMAASFVNAACARNERCLYFAFEESEGQMIRNMRSIGIDLGPWIESGLLQIHASRPTVHGLEMHLAMMHKLVSEFQPDVVVVDPISNLISVGNGLQVRSMLTRLIDFLKSNQITALFNDLTQGGGAMQSTEVRVSSLMDTWLLLGYVEENCERNRVLSLLKSRGMAHSNQMRELILSDDGIHLTEVYAGTGGVLTGLNRLTGEAKTNAAEMRQTQDLDAGARAVRRRREALKATIAALRAEYESELDELDASIARERAQQIALEDDCSMDER
ncbi:MAG: circadian clock protein KaiC [Methanomicrobiaceae archaeon]|nr:circadian clock protein KaiC [Methanomicrobiaceae archaeon]